MLKNAFLILLSILITLGVVEIGLRLFDPLNFQPHVSRKLANVPLVNEENYFCAGGPKRLQPHDVVFSRETPNQSYFEFRNDIVSFQVINEHGFRGSFSSGDDKAQIPVLGDSFIRGTLSDETETIPAFLSRWSQDSHFVNLGTGGHGTLQHALTYDEFKDEIPHDTVLLFVFNRNDLIDNVRFRKWQDNPGTRNHTPTFTQRLKRGFASLYVGKLLLMFKTQMFDRNLLPSVPTETEQTLFFESIRSLSQAAAANGARLIVFSLPDISEFVGEDRITFREDPVGYSDEVRDLIDQAATENGLTWLDLKPAAIRYAADRDIPASDLYGAPDHHHQEIGNFVIATEVARFLGENDLAQFVVEDEFVDLTRFDPSQVACP